MANTATAAARWFVSSRRGSADSVIRAILASRPRDVQSVLRSRRRNSWNIISKVFPSRSQHIFIFLQATFLFSGDFSHSFSFVCLLPSYSSPLSSLLRPEGKAEEKGSKREGEKRERGAWSLTGQHGLPAHHHHTAHRRNPHRPHPPCYRGMYGVCSCLVSRSPPLFSCLSFIFIYLSLSLYFSSVSVFLSVLFCTLFIGYLSLSLRIFVLTLSCYPSLSFVLLFWLYAHALTHCLRLSLLFGHCFLVYWSHQLLPPLISPLRFLSLFVSLFIFLYSSFYYLSLSLFCWLTILFSSSCACFHSHPLSVCIACLQVLPLSKLIALSLLRLLLLFLLSLLSVLSHSSPPQCKAVFFLSSSSALPYTTCVSPFFSFMRPLIAFFNRSHLFFSFPFVFLSFSFFSRFPRRFRHTRLPLLLSLDTYSCTLHPFDLTSSSFPIRAVLTPATRSSLLVPIGVANGFHATTATYPTHDRD